MQIRDLVLRFIPALLLVFCSLNCGAEPLRTNSPELKQLSVMGYEVEPPDADDTATYVKLNNQTVVLSQVSDHLQVYRRFERPKNLTDKEELQLLEIINERNGLSYFQVVLDDTSIVVSLYRVGPYDSRGFAHLIRLIDTADRFLFGAPGLAQLYKK